MKTVHLGAGRDKSVRHRHPWIFRGAIDRVEGEPEVGETVRVVSAVGTPLGVGAFSPRSQITVRMWSIEKDKAIDADFFREKLRRSIASRATLAERADVTAYRLVHAESDGLPGLHVDRYGDFLVVQFLAAGAERWRAEIVTALAEIALPRGIFERSDVDVRGKEGLPPRSGSVWGEEPPPFVEIREGDRRFHVDVRRGHKTGFYLDQRESRRHVGEIARDRDVLNAFAYSGGFAIHALAGGATQVTNIESSAWALGQASVNLALNALGAEKMLNVEGDVFKVLRTFREESRSFDLVILDPPKFADSKATVEKAARGYKDINLLAFRLLRPGGTLVTFSCSGLMPADLFQKIVADAALDAERVGRIVKRLGQPSDHPTALAFPEGSYLKGLVVETE